MTTSLQSTCLSTRQIWRTLSYVLPLLSDGRHGSGLLTKWWESIPFKSSPYHKLLETKLSYHIRTIKYWNLISRNITIITLFCYRSLLGAILYSSKAKFYIRLPHILHNSTIVMLWTLVPGVLPWPQCSVKEPKWTTFIVDVIPAGHRLNCSGPANLPINIS